MIQKTCERIAGGLGKEVCARVRVGDGKPREIGEDAEPLLQVSAGNSSSGAGRRRAGNPSSSRRTRIGTATLPGSGCRPRRLGRVLCAPARRTVPPSRCVPARADDRRLRQRSFQREQTADLSARPGARSQRFRRRRPRESERPRRIRHRRLSRLPWRRARRSPRESRNSATATASSRKAACWSRSSLDALRGRACDRVPWRPRRSRRDYSSPARRLTGRRGGGGPRRPCSSH